MPMLPRAIKYIELAQSEDWNCDKIKHLENAEYEILMAKKYYKKHDDKQEQIHARQKEE